LLFRLPRSRVGAISLLALLALLGCDAVRSRLPGMGGLAAPGQISEYELRQLLGDYASLFIGTIGNVADQIEERSADRNVDKRTLLWKVRMAPLMQDAGSHADARIAYARVLGVAMLQRAYLAEGDGRDLFGGDQPLALDAARQLQASALELGSSFLSEAQLERVRKEVAAEVGRRPIRGREFDVRSIQLGPTDPKDAGNLGWLVSLPLAPFSALEGVGSGAAAIHEFNETAQSFSNVVAGLPEVLRWEIELLLWDVEGRETVTQGLASLQQAAASAERVSLAAEALPENLRALLAESSESLARANETITASQELARSVSATAEQLRVASASWEKILVREGPRDPNARSFDVREYEAAAREIGAAAARLEALGAELRALGEAKELAPGVVQAVATADSAARGWIDAAAWRLVQVMGAGFLMLLAYRTLASRLAGSRRGEQR
jgi:hypothetical protein